MYIEDFDKSKLEAKIPIGKTAESESWETMGRKFSKYSYENRDKT